MYVSTRIMWSLVKCFQILSTRLFLILILREKAYVTVSATILQLNSSLSLSVTVIFQALGHKSVLKNHWAINFRGLGNCPMAPPLDTPMGGYLANRLITQTTRFNAALSSAEHVIDWRTNDMPISDFYFLGGYPWQKAERIQEEAALLHVNKVRIPTHLATDEMDVRVLVAQSYLSESSLHVLNVSHKLLVFPGEGHEIQNNPCHEKIKLREEIRWLNKYGSICLLPCEAFLVSSAHRHHTFIPGFVISIFVRLFYLLNI
jgi:hypothetical protein